MVAQLFRRDDHLVTPVAALELLLRFVNLEPVGL
jgi:hypothetical protein